MKVDNLSINKTSSLATQASTSSSQPENIKTLLDKLQLIGNTKDAVATISQQAPPAIQDLQKAAASLNQLAERNGLNAQFEVVDNGQKVIIVVRDSLDNTIIREIPGYQAINLSRLIDPKQGVLFSMSI